MKDLKKHTTSILKLDKSFIDYVKNISEDELNDGNFSWVKYAIVDHIRKGNDVSLVDINSELGISLATVERNITELMEMKNFLFPESKTTTLKSLSLTRNKKKIFTEEEVLEILTIFAFRVDTHYMTRDYDAIRKYISENREYISENYFKQITEKFGNK